MMDELVSIIIDIIVINITIITIIKSDDHGLRTTRIHRCLENGIDQGF